MPPADDVKSRGGRGGGRRGGVGARGSGRGSIHQHMVNGRGPAGAFHSPRNFWITTLPQRRVVIYPQLTSLALMATEARHTEPYTGMGAHTGIVPRPAVASPFVMGQMLQQRATPSGVPGTPMQMVGVHTGQAQALSMPPGGSVAGVSMQAQQQQQPPTMSMGGPGTHSNGLGMGVNVGVVTGAGSPPLPQQPPLPPTQQQQGQQIQQYPPPPRGPPLRTPSGGGLPRPGTGTSAPDAQAKHAQLTLKDLEKARVLMEAEIDADGECAQSAL